MRVLSILANPKPDSFCHALFTSVNDEVQRLGHTLVAHDLYAEGFDPVLKENEAYTFGDTVEDVLGKTADPLLKQHRRDLMEADGMVVVHPNWWGMPPAILTGWLDRVLVPGVAYRLETGEGEPEGLLGMNACLVVNTSDTLAERENAVLGDPLNLIWRNCILPYCGVEKVERAVFRPVAGSTPAQREHWLSDVKTYASLTFPAS